MYVEAVSIICHVFGLFYLTWYIKAVILIGARADPGKEYVIYVRKGINEIDLTNIPGTFAVEWTHLSETIFRQLYI